VLTLFVETESGSGCRMIRLMSKAVFNPSSFFLMSFVLFHTSMVTERALEEPTYFYMHVPKVAGLSVLALLGKEFGPSLCRLYSPPIMPDASTKCIEYLSGRCLIDQQGCFFNNFTKPLCQCRMIIGMHLDYTFVHQAKVYYPSTAIRALAMVRHPIKRLASEMAFLQKCVEFPSLLTYSNKWNLTTLLQLHSSSVVLQSSFFAGDSPFTCGTRHSFESAHYDKALSNARNFAFIGVLERLSDSMRLLSHVLGWQHERVLPRTHACHNEDLNSVPSAVFDTIAGKYPLEIKFYENLVNLFEQQLLKL